METEIPKQLCPHCGYRVEVTTDPTGDHTPSPGDVSICLNCGKVAIFGENHTLHKPTPEKERELNLLPEVMRVQFAIAMTVNKDLRKKQKTS